MKIYRSGVNITASNICPVAIRVFEAVNDWHRTESIEGGKRFYLRDDLYFTVTYYENNTGLKILINYGTDVGEVYFGTPYNYIEIYKTDTSMFICPYGDDYVLDTPSEYCCNAVYIVNTVDNSEVNVLSRIYNDSYCTCIGEELLGDDMSIALNGRYQDIHKKDSSTTQLVPFYNSKTGKRFNDLYQILTSRLENGIVVFNDQKWLFIKNFAVSCGNTLEYEVITI